MSSSSFSSPEITPAMGPDIRPDFSYKNSTHDEVLEDLSSRFILNLPDEELASLERISFQVEQAHWFYEDFIREQNSKLPSLTLKKFSAMLFKACPLLHQWSHDHEQAFNTFMQYKTRVPVCGAIMLNETWEKCVLVKGWKASSGWGFPKGKINESEPQTTCAIREVLEETGYNLAGQVNPHDVIEMTIKEQKIAMYIVPDVPEDYPFKTKTRKEISRIDWFKLSDLPTWRRNNASPGKFYLISPFIGPLRSWIASHKPQGLGKKTRIKAASFCPSSPIPEEHDANQESSSQSSSADNGDPQTPSPQYTQSSAHPVVHDDLAQTTDTSIMDPHFARLLSSLTMSGMAKAESKEVQRTIGSKESNTPTPETFPSIGLQPTNREASSLQPSDFPHPPASNMPSLHTQSSQQPTPSSTRVSPSPSSSENRAIPANTTVSPVELPAAPSVRVSRRSSSIADISPYLKKHGPPPTSASHLKQLALLESIVSESTTISRRLDQAEQSLLQSSKRSQHPHSLTPGFTFPPVYNRTNDIYTSGTDGRQSVAGVLRSPASNIVYDDPFKVRPRTSLAAHRPMMPLQLGSLNHSQMMTMINGQTPSIIPSHATPYSSIASPIPYGGVSNSSNAS
ncbi:Dcp2, box A domain-containing protein [Desarmillaria ectypa]|nr:Dcp2, box A domain-containing protein [Desarmillaria ectypa]